jgi:hypothetical protein
MKRFISQRVAVAPAPKPRSKENGVARRGIVALRWHRLPLVLLTAWALAACSGGPVSSSSTAGTEPPTPAGTATTVATRAQVAPPTYGSKAFILPFDVTPPAWEPTPPSVEQHYFVSWEAPDATRAVRFLVPVYVYPPGGSGTTAPPKDYLAYLLGQSGHGAKFADVVKTRVGDWPATLVTATALSSLDGSLGCPKAGLTAGDCFGLQADLVLRIAVVNVRGKTLLIWLRQNLSADAEARNKGFASFKDMLSSIRFSNRAVQPLPAAAAATAIDGIWTASWTHDELMRSPLTEPGEDNDENWGQYSLTFNRGRVTEAQQNPLATSSGSGTFRLVGDTLVYDRDNGEHFVMRWSLKGNQLTLRRDGSLGVVPTPFVIKPWAGRP